VSSKNGNVVMNRKIKPDNEAISFTHVTVGRLRN